MPEALSYIDAGGRGRPLVALHCHFGVAGLWSPLAETLAPQWRVIAPDLPGHGGSVPATRPWLDDAVERVAALIERLGLRAPVLMGHSSGGIVAYTLAARRPALISALVNVEAPAVVGAPPDAADAPDHPLMRARMELMGDHWLDWRGSRMPGLVIRGGNSPRLAHAHARELAARRSRTRLVELAGCGHSPQDDDPDAFAAALRAFLDNVIEAR